MSFIGRELESLMELKSLAWSAINQAEQPHNVGKALKPINKCF